MGTIITVISGKDGVGKTMIAAAVSSGLAVLGHKTLCIDFGKGSKNIRSNLCMIDNEAADHNDLYAGLSSVVKACPEHPEIPGLFILSPSASLRPDKLNISDIKPIFNEIRREFDFCIIDTPPVSYPGFKLAHADANMVIIITTGKAHGISDVKKAVKSIQNADVSKINVLVNRILPKNTLRVIPAVSEAAGEIGAHLIGQIPEDEIISQSLHSKNPLILYKYSRMFENILHISRVIADDIAATPLPLSPQETQATSTIQEAPQAPTPPQSPLSQPSQATQATPTIQEPQPPQPPLPQAPQVASRESPQSADDLPVSDNESNIMEDTSKFLGAFGDPKLWARSTLKDFDINNIIRLYTITPGLLVAKESIRDRMWLHDLLDDNGILYHIESGSMNGSKDLIEAQNIYIQKEDAEKAVFLINNFHDTNNIINDTSGDDDLIVSDDGIPQKICSACGEEIDFDYHKCPHCKAQVG